MKRSILLLRLSLLLAALLALRPASAQVTLTGTNYFQDFNNLTTDAALPSGWGVYEGNITPGAIGNLVTFKPALTAWSSSAGQFANYASTIDNNGNNLAGTETTNIQNAATNRAPAVRETGAFGDGNFPNALASDTGLAFAFEIDNSVGLGNFKLDVDLLLLSVQTRTTVWNIEYGFGTPGNPPTSFIPVATQTNLIATAGGVFGATHKTVNFGTALDNQPGNIWIRIVTDTYSTGSGSRPTFGIDNFSLTYAPIAVTVNPVVIISQPQSSTNNAGSSVTFTVGESGTGPVMNQWYQVVNGNTNQLSDSAAPSGDGSTITGSTSSSLTISGILGGETASYFVTAGNSVTAATNSANATLTVIDPIVNFQPLSRTNVAGDLDEFDATVFSSNPTELIWYHGTNIISDTFTTSGGFSNATTIFVTNSVDTIGNYYLVATDPFGSVTSIVVTASLPVGPTNVITRWDFNEPTTYTPTNPLAAVGTGVGATVGGPTITNYTFPNGALADPFTGTTQLAWGLQDGPPQGTSNKMTGFQFNTSTAGFQDIFLTWQERHSATASSYMRLQYTTNGTDFIDADVIRETVVAFNFASANLAAKPGVANNPNFAFRIVSEFESTAIGSTNTNYVATTSTSAYGPGAAGGTVRINLMTVFGNAVGSVTSPIPLLVTTSGTNIVLTWSNPAFQIETATAATGPWSAPITATSPFTNAIGTGQKYFRLIK